MRAARRFVVKVGSTLVTNRGAGLDASAIARWAEQVAKLRQGGNEFVLVSSGAIAEGMQRLGWTRRPHAMHELQAAAAVGQMGLAQVYESCFRQHGLHTAQVLAAKRAARSGAQTVIASGHEPDVLVRLAAGEAVGTLLTAQTTPLAARKQWLADHVQVGGRLSLDAGAAKALRSGGKSLLPIGVKGVEGEFERGAVG